MSRCVPWPLSVLFTHSMLSNTLPMLLSLFAAIRVQAVSCGAGLANHRIAQREGDAKPEADAFYGAGYTAGAASETEKVTLKGIP